MTAIETKYIPPSHTKPSRIKAFTRASGRPQISIIRARYPSNGFARESERHWQVAIELIKKLNWQNLGEWQSADTENGMVFVCVSTNPK